MSDEEDQPERPGDDGSSRDDGRTYFNHCRVNLSLTTAKLDFGQASEADQSVRVTSRLITSPSYFRQMGALIRAECSRYDQAFEAAPGERRKRGEG